MVESFKLASDRKISLKDFDAAWLPDWASEKTGSEDKNAVKEQATKILVQNKRKLAGMQRLFWASDTYAMLLVLQGMDTSGKDGVIRHVMSGLNPQGCQVFSFKTPTEEELDHDFLWRHSKALPERGRIGIFNRSYYEEVLITKVRPEILARQKLPAPDSNGDFWNNRYQDINNFEHHLVRSGTVILKFFLHISKSEQKQRLLKRLKDPEKHWKFSLSDLSERARWEDYQQAYQDMLNKTSTTHAPWYIIPANKKWIARTLISDIIVAQIEKLNLSYPKLTKQQQRDLQTAKTKLCNE
ncbi:MAG: polyphosphate kinase 2 family protein [Candidatus Bathyarchaeota archaeon]|nr:polyphosphate kinase 2 family protein [Candidatus Bathyarchaeota archaeon]